MTTAVIHGTLSPSEHSVQLRKAVIASTIGTAIEWYDFFLYGTAAGLIFGKLYFPNEDALTATLAAFGMSALPPKNTLTDGFRMSAKYKSRHCPRFEMKEAAN